MLARVVDAGRQHRASAADARRAARLLERAREPAKSASALLEDDADLDDDAAWAGDFDDADVAALSDEQIAKLLAEIEAGIEADRRADERAALEAADKAAADEVEELLAFRAASMSIAGDDPAEFLLCPVCSNSGMLVRNGVLFCSCGVRFDAGATENVTLDMVRERLAKVFANHATRNCMHPLRFEMRKRFDFTFMHAGCPHCGMDEIVL